jgi:hypothetical protein
MFLSAVELHECNELQKLALPRTSWFGGRGLLGFFHCGIAARKAATLVSRQRCDVARACSLRVSLGTSCDSRGDSKMNRRKELL